MISLRTDRLRETTLEHLDQSMRESFRRPRFRDPPHDDQPTLAEIMRQEFNDDLRRLLVEAGART